MTNLLDPADMLFLGLTAKDVLIAGGWLLTILGWFVSNLQANRRERRKEARAEIDACIKLLTDLVQKARIYFCGSDDADKSKHTAAEIKFELQRVLMRVERLEKRYVIFDVFGACGELMDAITSDPFESAQRQLMAPDSDHMMKIESDAHVLISQMEEGFTNAFG